jgi:chromosome segregation ATPase
LDEANKEINRLNRVSVEVTKNYEQCQKQVELNETLRLQNQQLINELGRRQRVLADREQDLQNLQITADNFKRCTDDLNAKNQEILRLQQKNEQLTNENRALLSTQTQSAASQELTLKDVRRRLQQSHLTVEQLEKELIQTRPQLNECRTNNTALQTQLDTLRSQLTQCQQETKRLTDQNSELGKCQKELDSKAAELNSKAAELVQCVKTQQDLNIQLRMAQLKLHKEEADSQILVTRLTQANEINADLAKRRNTALQELTEQKNKGPLLIEKYVSDIDQDVVTEIILTQSTTQEIIKRLDVILDLLESSSTAQNHEIFEEKMAELLGQIGGFALLYEKVIVRITASSEVAALYRQFQQLLSSFLQQAVQQKIDEFSVGVAKKILNSLHWWQFIESRILEDGKKWKPSFIPGNFISNVDWFNTNPPTKLGGYCTCKRHHKLLKLSL